MKILGNNKSKLIGSLIVAMTVASSAGCDRGGDGLAPPGTPVVLALGDSITLGHTLEEALHYPALVQEKLIADGINVHFYNAGFPGDLCERAKPRAVELLGFKPVMMIIALGTNDITGKTTPEDAEQSLAAAIEAMQAENVAVFLIGSQVQRRSAERLQAFAEMYERLAKRYDVPLVLDILAPASNDPELILEDNIHPTAAGQVAIAEMLYPPLKAAVIDAIARREETRANSDQN